MRQLPRGLTIFQAYRVETVAGRKLDLLFRGRPKAGNRLWFTELDAPYGDVFLKQRHIKSITKIGATR
jgi:hypothetical protein